MNLKEAFRFQNKLQALIGEAPGVLGDTSKIVTVENTYMRKIRLADCFLYPTDAELFGGLVDGGLCMAGARCLVPANWHFERKSGVRERSSMTRTL